MQKKLYLFIFSGLLFLQSSAQLQWPSITNQTRPWTRWWWEGSAVNPKDLSWNLEQYKSAGLGGVELTPIYGIHGYEKLFTDFLSPQWMQHFKHTLTESKRLGLGVDLANGTGWPFGGPWVSDDDASKSVYFKTYALNAGEQLKEIVEYRQEGFVRTANNKTVSIDTLIQPAAANKNLQGLALDQVIFPGKLPLQLLMAYSDKGSSVDLTSKLDASGKLNWTAPEGKWNLFAIFMGLHGKMVERAAPGGEGYAIDHFSASAVNNYFKKFDGAFRGQDISYLRAFFNDSYEVDDARGQANWSPQFFAEFKTRRGYELKDHLAALFGKADTEKSSRVIYDYRATIDELLLEHFTEAWKKWAGTKGALVRNQSHGSPANTLDLYSAVDIPETEGTDVLRFKFASSAAHVTGKNLASSESATWLNEHFLTSWGDVKKAIDLYFIGGVNHIFYHGTEYSPKNVPWPGWLFYAAVHFQPTNPQWKDFKTLNDYITRVQSFLQTGRPVNDVLVYYPIIDRYSEPGRDLLQHFDGMERNFDGTDFKKLSEFMLEKGYSFDFISDRQLKEVKFTNGNLLTGGNTYKTILLPGNKYISDETFKKLAELSKLGAKIMVYKELPLDVPGFGNLESRRTAYRALESELVFTDNAGVRKSPSGKGFFILGDDIEEVLKEAGISREQMVDEGLHFTKRINSNGICYFINNRTDKSIDKWITLQLKSGIPAIFDPMTGKNGWAKYRKNKNGFLEIDLQLLSYSSIIVQLYSKKNAGLDFPYYKANKNSIELKSGWNLEFLDGGPVLPAKLKSVQLGSWTDLGGEEVKNFSGTAKYSIAFSAPSFKARSWLLDLGKINETAEIFLNGKKITTLIGPVFQVVIPASAFQKNNKLEIIVANLMANRIAYMDRNQLPWKIFYNTNMPARKKENVKNGLFDASAWSPLPSGISGPVVLTALENE